MTQFSNAPILSGKRPDGAFLSGTQLENAITTDSLQVFNVPSVGAINQSNGLSELRQAFGLLGNVVQGAGQITAEARAKQEVFDRGEAASRSSLDNIDVARSFDENPDSIPDGVKASEYATSLVEAQINTQYANKSEAWKNTYRENSAPKLANLVRSHLDQRQNVKTAEALTGFSELAYNGNIDEALKGARALPGITDQQVYAGVILPGLKTASATGNQEAFDRLAKALPEGQFKQTVDLERTQLQGAMLRRDAQQQQNAMAMFEEIANSQPPEIAADALRQMRESGTLSASNAAEAQAFLDKQQQATINAAGNAFVGSVVNAVRDGTASVQEGENQITQHEATFGGVQWGNKARETYRAALREQTRVQEQQDELSAKNSVIRMAAESSMSGTPLNLVRDVKMQLPSGKEITITESEIKDQTATVMLTQLSRGLQPQAALAAGVDWSASNGIYPREYRTLIDTAPGLATVVENGDKAPPALVSAIALYQQAKNAGGNWYQGLGNERSRSFMEAVLANTKDGGMTLDQAVRMANRAETLTAEQKSVINTVVSDSAKKVVPQVLPSDIQGAANFTSVYADIVNRANAVARGTNSPDTALKSAASDYAKSYVLLGNYASPTNQADMTPNLRAGLSELAPALTARFAKEAGRQVNGLSLVWDGSSELWRVNDELGRPLSGKFSAFRTADLAAILHSADSEKYGAEVSAIGKKINARIENQRSSHEAGMKKAQQIIDSGALDRSVNKGAY